MSRSIENSSNIFITTNNNSSLNDGSISSPSLSFKNDGKLGLYRIGNNTLGICSDEKNRMVISAADIDCFIPLKVPSMRITDNPGVGRILTSDASGNASWVAPAPAATLSNPVSSTSFVATGGLGSIVSAAYVSYEITNGTARVVNINGRFTFDGTLTATSSGWVEIAINSIISGFAPQTVHGVVNTTSGGFIEKMSYGLSITETNTRIRIEITNNSGGSYLGGAIRFSLQGFNT